MPHERGGDKAEERGPFLDYLSIETGWKIAIGCGRGLCEGCFTGVYPIEVPEEVHKDQFERGR